MRENEKQADDPVGSEANPKALEWVKPLEVEVRLWKVMESWGTNHDTTCIKALQEIEDKLA